MRRPVNDHLASYAMRAEESQGRRYRESPHPFRDAYERDRDRIIHSRAFRRLENKTQVFTRRYSDHFRTRLTHTLEVAQISRTVGKGLGLNNDLIEALALVHDVGHPPFGHAGEAVLNRQMALYQDSFDHNLQALRIVEHFEQKYVEFPGLNLTFEVREGIIKHSRDYDPVLYPGLAAYGLDERPPLEAQLIDIADEIAYNCADLDDGYEAKLLTLPQIRTGVRLFDSLYRTLDRKYPAAREKLKFNEALKAMLNILVTDLIHSTRRNLARAGVKSVADVRAQPRRLVGLGSRRARENKELKDFLYVNLYSHRQMEAERKLTVQRVGHLFSYYLKHPRSLPALRMARTEEEPLHRVVCDYIAGMTDNYFLLQYHKHCEA